MTLSPFLTAGRAGASEREGARRGLAAPSRIMVDKVATTSKQKIGQRIGELDGENIARLAQAAATFLGLAVSQ